MHHRVNALLAGVGLLILSCAQKSIAPTSFSPAYKSMLDPSEVSLVKSCAVASSVVAKNGLPGSVVGKRTLEGGAVAPQPISLTGDPTGWVRSAAREIFRQAGVRTTTAGAPVVTLSLYQVLINENVHVNAGYDARVVIDATVVDGRGRTCWSERKTGTAQNYGHHGSAEAYRETVDHALDRALMSVATDDGFQEALCTRCSK
ncbi:hypothetical protein ACW73L_09140 [Methylolobus aquaticus]